LVDTLRTNVTNLLEFVRGPKFNLHGMLDHMFTSRLIFLAPLKEVARFFQVQDALVRCLIDQLIKLRIYATCKLSAE
jgi:hypothetical protein